MPGMPEPGVEWAGFRIEERIGSGGFGRLFTAWDIDADRRVVLKVVDAGADSGAEEGSRQRFLRESRLAAAVDHPRIVPIHRVDEIDGMALVVMDHIGGGDLGQQIHIAPLTLERARSVLGQLGGALDHAHRAGLVHRSIEPANILCAPDGDEVYLTDFGAPSASVHHASPEFVRGEVLTPASDIYSLGCTLFECLTGRVPFPAATLQAVADLHVGAPVPRVTDLRPDLPAELDEIVARALAKNASDRYPTARHLAEAVALVRATSPAVTPPAAVAPTRSETGVVPDAFADTAAIVAATSSPEPPASRSVFDDDATTAMAAVGTGSPVDGASPADGPGDGTMDGAEFGIYDEEQPRSRVPLMVVTALVLATAVVGALTWRAVNTEAELASGSAGSATTQPSVDLGSVEPTVAAAEALVPDGVDTCVPPGDVAGAESIVLLCPLDDVPEALSIELFASAADRDAHFEFVAAELGVSDRDDAECALGRVGRHPYSADGHGGVVACTESRGVVDFMWTRDDAPAVLRAHGGGRFAEYAEAWAELAGRTDARFPTADEQELLDALPDELLVDCRRDLTLALEAGGEVAAACEPPEVAPTVVSWVVFADNGPMDRWIAGRRAALVENNFDQTDDGCSPQGFGQVAEITEEPGGEPGEAPSEAPGGDDQPQGPSGPPPDAAYLDYDLDGSSGKVLCFVNTSGLNAVFWTRDGSRIASIAVSDRNAGDSMVELLRWWRDGGHRP